MGATQSRSVQGEDDRVRCPPVTDVDIRNNGIRLLWAYNSTTGDRYVCLADKPPAGATDDMRIVAATGEEDALTKIKYHEAGLTEDKAKLYELSFENRSKSVFKIEASDIEVKASKTTNNATLFRVRALTSPNKPYVVLESDQKNSKGEILYLSSDGVGKMKLKVWNKPVPGPVRTTFEVDPALLFRLVRPLNEPTDSSGLID